VLAYPRAQGLAQARILKVTSQVALTDPPLLVTSCQRTCEPSGVAGVVGAAMMTLRIDGVARAAVTVSGDDSMLTKRNSSLMGAVCRLNWMLVAFASVVSRTSIHAMKSS